MTKRMLIDASHAEETRVVVLDGNRLEDFDVETQSRRQLKGNIYLAKVVRVEPSLQAAFVEYGGNRHGFLAFGEIHPDYYQIPVADRQRLLQMQEEEARAEEEAEEAEDRPEAAQPLAIDDQPRQGPAEDQADEPADEQPEAAEAAKPPLGVDAAPEAAEPATEEAEPAPAAGDEAAPEPEANAEASSGEPSTGTRVRQVRDEGTAPEAMGGEPEQGEERQASRSAARFMRSYKIQEVIRRRQILLIQVVKEERGTKGAALTTYISLAGRYCVLMPNSPRGGGISRKITSAADRRRLKEVTAELDIPRGMGLIVRTAGAMRPKPEIRRDGEYLLRLWDDIREQTMQSMAPSLIYEEATLIKRAIRDVYSRDVDELLIDGEDGWRAARDFMRMLMPAHVKKVQLWPQGGQPLFAHSQVESMLDAMLNPTVQLKSGGYLVINQTEALVAIDVNSGRSTRERGIEETALRTNLEAAEEAARQLRLRDLAGLVVIDFIDMESKKHNAMVERRMAESLKNDRARIQVGHISHFGLMELSRQRLRPSLAETSLTICEHCGGSGHVRSTESASLHVLREIEEEGGRQRAAEIMVHVAPTTALYILNNKRQRLAEIEQRYRMIVCFAADETLHPAQTRIDRVRAQTVQEFLPPPVIQAVEHDEPEPDAEFEEDAPAEEAPARAAAAARAADPDAVPGETAEEGEQRRRRRRRRRRGGRRDETATATAQDTPPLPLDADQPDIGPVALPEHAGDPELPPERSPERMSEAEPDAVPASSVPGHDEATEAAAEAEQTPAKRGRRGGRRRRKPGAEGTTEAAGEDAPPPIQAPIPYAGPTPANPFAMDPFDIFDVMDSLDRHPEEAVVASAPQPVEAPAAEPAEPAQAAAMPEPEAVPAAPAPEPEPAVAVSEQPVSAPAIQPVLIGAADPAADKKKGWWRR